MGLKAGYYFYSKQPIFHTMKPSHRPSWHCSFLKRFLLFFIACTGACNLQAQTIYYVLPLAAGTGSGSGWANAAGATQLQAIIDAADSGSQVWVGAGTYYPQSVPAGSISNIGLLTYRDFAFTLKNGLAVYGGFAGVETSLSQRNITANPTILSGDLGTENDYTDDCYHVVIDVGNNPTAILDGFTISGGYAFNGTGSITYDSVQINRLYGGGLYLQGSSPSIDNCLFTNNNAVRGGGLYNVNAISIPQFNSCTFLQNQAQSISLSDGGGGIYNEDGAGLTLDSCIIESNNSNTHGGGIYCGNSSSLFLAGCSFLNNLAAGGGGAMFNDSFSNILMTGCNFSKNTAVGFAYGGGGVFNLGTAVFNAKDCGFNSNTAVNSGGGIYFGVGCNQAFLKNCTIGFNTAVTGNGGGIGGTGLAMLFMDSCTYTLNSGQRGGGLYLLGGSHQLTRCNFNNNISSAGTGIGGAGAFFDTSANANLFHCLFSGNVASGDGGGQYNNYANTNDSSCVFLGNKSLAGNGGGLVNNGSGPNLWNCVLISNMAAINGGGMYTAGSNGSSYNCTIYNNSATTGAGVYITGDGSYGMFNQIIWGNINDNLVISGNSGSIVYSNVGVPSGIFPGTGNISANPNFVDGAYIGNDGIWGTADDGLELMAGSPCIDAVPLSVGISNYATTDITGLSRPQGPAVDMGAYEAPLIALLPIQLDDFSGTLLINQTDRIPETLLNWSMANDNNISAFNIERSSDGRNFILIGMVSAISGESVYQYTDEISTTDMTQTFYYRLEMVSTDKAPTLSPVVTIRAPAGQTGAEIRPNLVTEGYTYLIINTSHQTHLKIKLVDILGKSYFQKNLDLQTGYNQIPVDLSFPGRGIYFLQLLGEGYSQTLFLEKQ